jgi:hypothetical protein
MFTFARACGGVVLGLVSAFRHARRGGRRGAKASRTTRRSTIAARARRRRSGAGARAACRGADSRPQFVRLTSVIRVQPSRDDDDRRSAGIRYSTVPACVDSTSGCSPLACPRCRLRVQSTGCRGDMLICDAVTGGRTVPEGRWVAKSAISPGYLRVMGIGSLRPRRRRRGTATAPGVLVERDGRSPPVAERRASSASVMSRPTAADG